MASLLQNTHMSDAAATMTSLQAVIAASEPGALLQRKETGRPTRRPVPLRHPTQPNLRRRASKSATLLHSRQRERSRLGHSDGISIHVINIEIDRHGLVGITSSPELKPTITRLPSVKRRVVHMQGDQRRIIRIMPAGSGEQIFLLRPACALPLFPTTLKLNQPDTPAGNFRHLS